MDEPEDSDGVFYSDEYRTVRAALPVERVGAPEIDARARQKRIKAFERAIHEQNKNPQKALFAQVLEDKQKPPSP